MNHAQGHGQVRWNREIIWKMQSELAFSWDLLEEEVPNIYDSLKSDITKELETFKSTTEVDQGKT